ncbi:hypothetical protein J6590_054742 [Homalodisca vitripennis]|nr:hypothetical protein J6590_054742 [Homalodisca vitripennis]
MVPRWTRVADQRLLRLGCSKAVVRFQFKLEAERMIHSKEIDSSDIDWTIDRSLHIKRPQPEVCRFTQLSEVRRTIATPETPSFTVIYSCLRTLGHRSISL